MSKTERIYALLVEANPVPDPEALPERLVATEPHLTVVDPRRASMQETTERATKPQRRAWIPALGAAAVIIAAVAIGALIFANTGADTASDREGAAVARVEAYYAAINAGDAEAAIALMSPDGSLGTADTHVAEHNAFSAASYPFRVEGCEAVFQNDEHVRVECVFVNGDPVWLAEAVGTLTAPMLVFDDGHMQWRPFEGANFTEANRDYGQYLAARHLEEYEAVCSPSAYPGGSVAYDGGISITLACAELTVSVAQDVADWVEAGKPDL